MNKISESLLYCLQHGIPFAAFREPGKSVKVIISHPIKIFNALDILDLQDTDGFFVHPFVLSTQTPAYFFPLEFVFTQQTIHEFQPEKLTHHETRRFYREGEYETSKFEDYQGCFEAFQDALGQSELDKIVLSRRLVIPPLQPDAYTLLFESLCNDYETAFVSWFSIPGQTSWMGASPEILLKQVGDECMTVALAGTIPSENNNRAFTSKEEEEQDIVRREVLARISSYSREIRQDERKIVKAGLVNHLHTSFHFKLRPEGFIPLSLSLHPTSAVAGIPQEKAIQRILQTEKQPRGYYSGFLGLLSKQKESAFYVNLRCMEIHSNQICLYAGGGLTRESELYSEWQETEIKAQTLLAVIEKIKKFAVK